MSKLTKQEKKLLKQEKKAAKSPLDSSIKQALIVSIAAMLCVIIAATSITNCVDAVTKNMVKRSEIEVIPQAQNESSSDSSYNQNLQNVVSQDNNAQNTDEGTTTPANQESQSPSGSGNSSSASTSSTGSANQSSSKSESTVPSTKAEILNYFNNALNNAKAAKPGFTKHHVMESKGNVSGIPSWLVSIVNKNQTTTTEKGADNTDIFPAAGFAWCSKLTTNDITSATLKTNGDNYEILIKLGTEKNPAKGTTSSYGRIFSVIDAQEAANMVGKTLLKSIDMTYHDGYAKAVINSKTGKPISAEFSASADIDATILALGDVSAADIVSTETYTNFKW